MDTREELHDLAAEIIRAFSACKCPAIENILLESEFVDRSQAEILVSTRDWRSLSKDDIEQNPTALYVVSPEAYAYFLPAYLIYCITYFKEGWTVLQNTLSSLDPQYNGKFVCLNRDQAKVILKLIKVISSNESLKSRFFLDAKRFIDFWETRSS